VEKRFLFGAIIGCKGKTTQALRRHHRVTLHLGTKRKSLSLERRDFCGWRATSRSILDNCKKAAGPAE